MAAYFPEEPSARDKERAEQFFTSFITDAIEYPHLAKFFDLKSLKTESREDLAIWVCLQHNKYNAAKGTPPFECQWNNLKERWGPL